MNIIQGAGIFIYPLGLCSFLAVFMIVERWLALRTSKVIPPQTVDILSKGDIKEVKADNSSLAGRIIGFYQKNHPDDKTLHAYAKHEVGQLERGLFILDIIVGAAPLIGLLGTVVGLIQVFSRISPETGMPDPSSFVEGIALALTTTMLGLLIAIPAMVGNSYLGRRIEVISTKLEVLLEGLNNISRKA